MDLLQCTRHCCHTWSVTQRHFAQHALPPRTRCAHHSLYGLVAMYAKCKRDCLLKKRVCSNPAAVWTLSCALDSDNAYSTLKPAGHAVAARTLSRRLVQISKARQCSTSTMTSPHRVKHWRVRCRRAATALHGLPQLPALWAVCCQRNTFAGSSMYSGTCSRPSVCMPPGTARHATEIAKGSESASSQRSWTRVQVWRHHPDQLVGWFPRLADSSQRPGGHARYLSKLQTLLLRGRYSVALTKGAIMHSKWLQARFASIA